MRRTGLDLYVILSAMEGEIGVDNYDFSLQTVSIFLLSSTLRRFSESTCTPLILAVCDFGSFDCYIRLACMHHRALTAAVSHFSYLYKTQSTERC